MKTFARFAAVLSFSFFFLAGALAIVQPGLFATLLGLFLMGIAVFAGALLWLAAEKWCARPEGK